MSSVIPLGILAIICGAMIAVQASTNQVLLQHTGNIFWTAIMLFSLGLVTLLMLALVTGADRPSFSQLQLAPNWSFLGGIVVASYVVVITFLVPKLGVANAILLIVFGQIFAAVLIDHFGWFNVEITKIGIERLAGIALMLAGVYLARH